MASRRLVLHAGRFALCSRRPYTASTRILAAKDNAQEGSEAWRRHQSEKPLNPHLTSTTSTIANQMPSVGKDSPPPELISSVDGSYLPKDAVPENTERMTGGTQKPGPDGGPNKELEVGELEGASFKVEPKRRSGEDIQTLRARLLYQSRKRGTLESDLLLSTFADANLGSMSQAQLLQYDVFLDENDWDIYYWATQEPTPTSMEYAEGAGADLATPAAQGQLPKQETDEWRQGKPRSGEWAQTVGAFKPAYRPVPQRWKNSQILAMLRKHVKDRSAGGVHEARPTVEGKALNQHVEGTGGGGLGFMPPIRNWDT